MTELTIAAVESAIACDQLWITVAILGEDLDGGLAENCEIEGDRALSQTDATDHLLGLLEKNRDVLGDERLKKELYEATDSLLGYCDICVERLDRFAATLSD
jgi:hypothetical protein